MRFNNMLGNNSAPEKASPVTKLFFNISSLLWLSIYVLSGAAAYYFFGMAGLKFYGVLLLIRVLIAVY